MKNIWFELKVVYIYLYSLFNSFLAHIKYLYKSYKAQLKFSLKKLWSRASSAVIFCPFALFFSFSTIYFASFYPYSYLLFYFYWPSSPSPIYYFFYLCFYAPSCIFSILSINNSTLPLVHTQANLGRNSC